MKIVVNCTKPLWPEQARKVQERVAEFFGTLPENVLLLNDATVAVIKDDCLPEIARFEEV